MSPHLRPVKSRLLTRRRVLTSGFTFTLSATLISGSFAFVEPPSGGKKYALLIGIDEYEDKDNLNSLGAAAADARKLAQTLKDVAGFGTESGAVRLLVSDATDAKNRPTRNNIVDALDALVRQAKPGDTVFVMYSGHGIEIEGTSYLLPYDTRGTSDETLSDTGLAVARFRSRLEKVEAKVLFLAFDMCRTNPRKDKAGNRSTLSEATIDQGKLATRAVAGAETPDAEKAAMSTRTVATLFSCDRDQSSWEWATVGRGYFSYFLEQGLRGGAAEKDGTVRLGNLLAYVARETEAAVKRDKGGALQRPYSDLHGPGDAGSLVLAANVAPLPKNTGRGTISLIQTLVPELLRKAKVTIKYLPDEEGHGFSYLKVYALCSIAEAQAISGDVFGARESTRQALQVATNFDDFRDKAETLASIANMQFRLGNRDNAKLLFEKSVQAAKSMNSIGKCDVFINIARSQFSAGDKSGAKYTLTLAKNFVLTKNSFERDFGLRNITQAQVWFGDIPGALTTAKNINPYYFDAKDEALSSIVVFQAEKGNITAANNLTGSISTPKSKILALCAVARARARTGNYSAAKKMTEQAKLIAETMNSYDYSSRIDKQTALLELITVQARIKDMVGAKKTVGLFSTKTQKDQGLAAIVTVQAEMGDIAGAKQTMRDIATPDEKVSALVEVARRQIKTGNILEAEITARSITSKMGREYALILLVEGQLKRGNVMGAKQTVKNLFTPYRKADALSKIIKTQAQKGDYIAAQKTLDEIEGDPAKQIDAYCDIVSEIVKHAHKLK